MGKPRVKFKTPAEVIFVALGIRLPLCAVLPFNLGLSNPGQHIHGKSLKLCIWERICHKGAAITPKRQST